MEKNNYQWLEARYEEPGDKQSPVQITAFQHVLLIKDSFGEMQWPLAFVTQAYDAEGKMILQWPPHPSRVIVSDVTALNKMPWRRLLPDVVHQSKVSRGLQFVVSILLCACLIAWGVPNIGTQLSMKTEAVLFKHFEPLSPEDYCDGTASQKEAVEIIRKRIFPLYEDERDLPLKIFFARSAQANAFSAPGGSVFITDGLLHTLENGEQLAGTISHFIEHHKNRDALKVFFEHALSHHGLRLFFLGDEISLHNFYDRISTVRFSEDEEKGIDRATFARLSKAKVNAATAYKQFRNLGASQSNAEFVAAHPETESREKLFLSLNSEVSPPLLGVDKWQDLLRICENK